MRFFRPKGQKSEKFGIFRGNFANPNQRWLIQPDPSHKNLTQSGSKIFDLDPSLLAGDGLNGISPKG